MDAQRQLVMSKKFLVRMASLRNKLHKLKQFKFYPEVLLKLILSLKSKVTDNQDTLNLI